jgi:hypothetical protein
MKILDPGHWYEVDVYDSGGFDPAQIVTFMKRAGDGYPGNVGHYPGTNCQELIRVLIDRIKYLDNQIPCQHNKCVLIYLRASLVEFEIRAAERHGIKVNLLDFWEGDLPELIPACGVCGHFKEIVCKGHTDESQ